MVDFIVDEIDYGEPPADHEFLDMLDRQNEGIYDPETRKNGATAPTVTQAQEINPNSFKRYEIRDAKFAFQKREKKRWIIDGLIAPKTVNVWVGKYGSKKTWVMVDAAVCIVIEQKWLGRAVEKCKVLIIDEESGEDDLAERLQFTLRGEESDENADIYFISLGQFNLLKRPDDAILLMTEIINLGAQVVFIDALADIMAGGDENAVKDTQPVFMALRKIAETTGAAIVVIHHTNKAGGYRGSSAIPGAINTMVEITSEEGSPSIVFKTLKNRAGPPLTFTGQAHWEDDKFWMKAVETVYEKETVEAFILDYLEDGSETREEIMEAAAAHGLTKRAASDAIYRLKKNGFIFRANPNDNGRGTKAIFARRE